MSVQGTVRGVLSSIAARTLTTVVAGILVAALAVGCTTEERSVDAWCTEMYRVADRMAQLDILTKMEAGEAVTLGDLMDLLEVSAEYSRRAAEVAPEEIRGASEDMSSWSSELVQEMERQRPEAGEIERVLVSEGDVAAELLGMEPAPSSEPIEQFAIANCALWRP